MAPPSRFPLPYPHWRSLDWGAIALGVGFFCLYFSVGAALANSAAFNHRDLLFGADVHRVLRNITQVIVVPNNTASHPLFVLLVAPVTMLLKQWSGQPRFAVAIVMALAGAVGVMLAHSIFRRLGASREIALGGAVLFGLSASQFWFSATPETFGLGGLSLLAMWATVLRSPGQWQPALGPGLLAFGMTITNLVPASWLYFLTAPGSMRQRWQTLLRWGGMVLGLGLVLNGLQKLWLPEAGWVLMGNPEEVGHGIASEARYMTGLSLERAVRLVLHVLVFGVARPGLMVGRTTPPYPPNLRFAIAQPTLASGLAQLFWVLLLLLAMYGLYRDWGKNRDRGIALWGAGGVLGFNGALHLFYGLQDELFVYTPHWTGSLFVVVILGLMPLLWRRGPLATAVVAIAFAFALSQLWANGEWIRLVIETYRDPRYV